MTMLGILNFSRNRCTSVEKIDDATMRSCCRLQDTLMDAMVEITVGLPDLDVRRIAARVERTHLEECREPFDYLQKLIGIRVGPGMLKIIKGLPIHLV